VSWRRNCGQVVLALGVLCAGRSAWAQQAADKAAADTLFSEGKKLIAAGEVDAACAKFEASLAKVNRLGTQLALGSCYEKAGKTASAWAEFGAAARAAGKAHDPQRQHFAEEHAAALEARLSKLVIKLEPGYRVDGLEVKRDGVEVSAAELGSLVPVDPGEHTVEASAPGWFGWSTKVAVAGLPGVVEVIVPALGKTPVKLDERKASVVAAVAMPEQEDPSRNRRYLAYGVGVGGIAFVGASLVSGALASSKWSDAQTHCHDKRCDPTGVDLAGSARTLGNVSTATFLIGTAAVATGIVLYLKLPKEMASTRATALRVVPGVGPTQVGLMVQGGF
jgi:hypothetical protein